MDYYTKRPSHCFNSPATMGQLFDKAVNNMMNNQQFRSSMESYKPKHFWSCGFQVSLIIPLVCILVLTNCQKIWGSWVS